MSIKKRAGQSLLRQHRQVPPHFLVSRLKEGKRAVASITCLPSLTNFTGKQAPSLPVKCRGIQGALHLFISHPTDLHLPSFRKYGHDTEIKLSLLSFYPS